VESFGVLPFCNFSDILKEVLQMESMKDYEKELERSFRTIN